MSFDIDHFSSAEFRYDPYPTYAAMRRDGGVHWIPNRHGLRGSWMITCYDGVNAVLRSRATSKLTTPNAMRRCPYDHCLSNQDAPAYGRIKASLVPGLSAERFAAMAPLIGRIVDELLAPLVARGGGEFVSEFSTPLPARILAGLLAMPDALYGPFLRWSDVVLAGHDMSNDSGAARQTAMTGLTMIARTLVMQRRAAPADDLVGTMVRACDQDGTLSEDEMIGTLMLLMVVGHETTANLLANGLWLLATREDAYARVCREPERLPSAIEEVLRFESPAQRIALRTLTGPMTIGGVTIETGEHVSSVVGSANRDPAQFADPDCFDIDRQPNRHLSFGVGIRTCLAQSLARLQARIAFERLVAYAPKLRVTDARPHWRLTSGSVRGIGRLPVAIG